MGLCRALTAFFISPAASIGSAVVPETFFGNERGRYMGIWTAMVTLRVPVAPFIFGFVAMRVGLQNVGPIVGTILGEQVGGFLSDRWMLLRYRHGDSPRPDFRLWVSYLGHLLTIYGVVVFLVRTERASDTWNPTPIAGAAIAGAGNQIVRTVMMTYAVDSFRPDAAGI
ncbi:hypothetical protein QQZ08_006969 [Neonectria magnoliae]|uniref:Uncharacterized protein n=1 Tax=Neonectria magnoliae TaxID=2732573 RepID=A0ABR1I0T5_9HYPO